MLIACKYKIMGRYGRQYFGDKVGPVIKQKNIIIKIDIIDKLKLDLKNIQYPIIKATLLNKDTIKDSSKILK